MIPRARLSAFLLGLASTWNAGNVGPVATRLSDEFSVSLSEVGLLSGTFFFAGIVAAGIAGSELARRIPLRTGLLAGCALAIFGNVVVAASPAFAGLVAGRVVVGLGVGLLFLYAGGFARAAGGLRLIGILGAGITLGVAASLGIGGLFEELGVDWRWAFVLTALVALGALLMVPREIPTPAPRREPTGGLFREAFTSIAFWRLSLLATATLAIPFVIGAWLVAYLTIEYGLTSGLAGLIAFGLFGISTGMRYLGGRFPEMGAPPGALALGGCLLGAGGIAVLAAGDSVAVALLAVFLMGCGLSLPSALVYDEGETVLPGRPLGGLGLAQVVANVFPILAIPLIGAALSEGTAEDAFLAVAAVVLLAGLANLRPASEL